LLLKTLRMNRTAYIGRYSGVTKKKKFYIFGLRTAENFRALCTGKTMLSFCKIHRGYLREREERQTDR
jgi:hypothetical protein